MCEDGRFKAVKIARYVGERERRFVDKTLDSVAARVLFSSDNRWAAEFAGAKSGRRMGREMLGPGTLSLPESWGVQNCQPRTALLIPQLDGRFETTFFFNRHPVNQAIWYI